jgi:prepilin signal peptidase PulO-like enzyme (type II secretory pathway)
MLRWRSQCPQCGTPLKARNLIPLVSFLRQGGKCEHCKQKISSLYPILEISSALIFLLSFLAFQHAGIGIVIFRCIVNWLLLLLIIYDIMKYELHVPVRIILVIVIALPQLLWRGNYIQAGASAAFFVAIFLIIFRWAKWYVKKKYGADQEWFGEGDIYLAGTIGLLMPLVFQQHYIVFGRISLIDMFLLFIIGSGVLGIFFRLIIHVIKRRTPNMWINTISPLFRDKVLIPFIPAMIVAFRLLLRKADFFISFLFPW